MPALGRKNESLIGRFRRWVKHEAITPEAVWLPFACVVPVGHQDCALPGGAGLVQRAPNDERTVTWGSPSDALRKARCRVVSVQVAVPSRLRPACDGLDQNAVVFGRSILNGWVTTMARREGADSLAVEAGDQIGNGVGGAPPDGLNRRGVAGTSSDGQQEIGACNMLAGSLRARLICSSTWRSAW